MVLATILAAGVLQLAAPASTQEHLPGTVAAPVSRGAVKLAPFEVDGQRVSAEMQALWLVYGPCRQRLEEEKLARVIARELARRAGERARVRLVEREARAPFRDERERAKELEVLENDERVRLFAQAHDVEGEVELAYQDALADFARRAPALDPETEMRRSFRSAAWFRSQLRWARVFDRVFLPANEEERPDATVAALRARFGDEYETWKKPWRLADGSIDPQYQEVTRQAVRDHLYADEQFTTSLAGPDFSIAIAAGTDRGAPGWVLRTDAIWEDVAATVDPAEVELARQYWRTVIATRNALARERLLLAAKEADDAIAALRAQLQEFVPSFDAFAVQQQRFPSPETFREFYALVCGFQRKHTTLLAASTPEKPAQVLLDQLPRANARHGDLLVDAEVLLLSAWDFAHARWEVGGLDASRHRADVLLERIRANEKAWSAHEQDAQDPARFWSALVDERSEWWDPPPTPGVPTDPTVRTKHKGRFGPLDHQGLLEHLELSRYDLWTQGSALVDAVLFDLAPGAVGGPYPHRYGWCLVRLVSRSAPAHPLDLAVKGQRDAVEVDLLDESFRRFSRAAVEAAASAARPR